MHDQWKQPTTPTFRIFLCGGFRVERQVGAHYEALRTTEWGRSNYPRLLLKALICSHGRQARRDALLDILWPESDGEQAVQYLNSATTKLRKALQPHPTQESLLITEADFNLYRLEEQESLWVDADAAFALLNDAERQGRMSLKALPLLEEAATLFQKGTFLQDEEGQWAATRRATIEQARYRCQLWLAEAYEQHNLPGQAECALSLLLEEDPTDEDVLVRLMNLFNRQGMTQQALRVYRRTIEICDQDGLNLTEATQALASQLQKVHYFPPRQCELAENAPSSSTLADDKMEAENVRSHHTIEPTALSKIEITHAPLLNTGPSALSMLMEQQSLNFAALCRLGEPMMFDPTKRKTLEALLTAMSVALVQPQGLLQAETWKPLLAPTIDLAKVDTETMQGLQSLIEACWQLSRGNELALAEELLPTCMAKVVPLAQQSSPYQQEAINLAAQGFRLSGILALHRNDLFAKELYSKQAVHYSLLSGNRTILVASLRDVADTHRYNKQYPQMLQTYLNALQYMENISPLSQSCMHSGLAIAYAHIDQEQKALTHLGFAIDTFPEHPSIDPGYSFADFDRAWLILREGIIRTRLGQTKQALEAFQHINQPSIVIPERIRVEIVNQQGKAAIVSDDLGQAIAYVTAGITGARALGSQRRYSEAYENFQQMRLLWPQEKRVTELGELF